MTTWKQAAVICLLALAAVALYFCYLIAKPFLGPIVIAVMLAMFSIRSTRGCSSSFNVPAWPPPFRPPWCCSSWRYPSRS